jgi:hypothetical protein
MAISYQHGKEFYRRIAPWYDRLMRRFLACGSKGSHIVFRLENRGCSGGCYLRKRYHLATRNIRANVFGGTPFLGRVRGKMLLPFPPASGYVTIVHHGPL